MSGRFKETIQSWEEAFCDTSEHGQLLAEHTFLHNKILLNESDRAVGVLAPAFLDTVLEQLLRLALAKEESTDNLLRDQGPLSAFSARIDMARSLGLIEKDVWRDLHLFRKIRNDFAHSVDVHGFMAPQVAARCRELRTPPRHGGGSEQSPRNRFLVAAWMMVGELSRVIGSMSKRSN